MRGNSDVIVGTSLCLLSACKARDENANLSRPTTAELDSYKSRKSRLIGLNTNSTEKRQNVTGKQINNIGIVQILVDNSVQKR